MLFYLNHKVYERATIVPGIGIWVNIPLVMCVINAIFILVKGKGSRFFSIINIVCSVLIFIYAEMFFTFYDGYVLAGGIGSALQPAFYFMVAVVVVEMVKSITDKGKKNEENK